jgi:hypothetical protein
MSNHPSLSDEYSLGLAASSAMSKAIIPISTHPPLSDAFSLGQSATEWTPQHIEFLSLKEVTSLSGLIPVQVSDDDDGKSDPDFLSIRSRYSHNLFHSVFRQLYAVAMGYGVAFGSSRQPLLHLVDEVAWEVTSLHV